jgi:hypothetical protein
MAPPPATRAWPGPTYHVRMTFNAPLLYVYAWCTDFSPVDPQLAGEDYERRILSRTPRKVVYENLARQPKGWVWSRYDVRLVPPRRWYLRSTGNYRRVEAEYELTSLGRERTRLDLEIRRRPGLLEFERMPRRAYERSLTLVWRRFARALNADYLRSRSRRASRSVRPRRASG